jgi:hypothetical protein
MQAINNAIGYTSRSILRKAESQAEPCYELQHICG